MRGASQKPSQKPSQEPPTILPEKARQDPKIAYLGRYWADFDNFFFPYLKKYFQKIKKVLGGLGAVYDRVTVFFAMT